MSFVLGLFAPLCAQDERPMSLPVRATASLDAAALARSGRVALQLSFTTEETLLRTLAVRVELRHGKELVLRRDHAPPVPSKQWGKGTPVTYELPLVFATPPAGVAAGDTLDVWLGFVDAGDDGKVFPPLGKDVDHDGLTRLASFVFPDLNTTPDAAAVDAVIATALALAPKDPRAAWDQLEFAFRRLDDYPLKAKLQKALMTVGRTPPAPLSFEEKDIVQDRIREERARYLRQIAGRMFDQGKLLGALLLLDEVGGALQEQADRAVLGALADARRITQDRDGIVAKVFELDKEQKAAVDALVEKHQKGQERLAKGLELAKDKTQRAIARELIRTLEFTPELRKEAEQARALVEKAWLADVPPDERAEAEAAMNHPCWARTSTRASHRIVFLGPQQLVSTMPDDSLLRFDLAYLYLTDLFGRVPNPDGDRVTVYWKELWDFGGGVGGGKRIDIGNAKHDAKGTRADTGLLYHELTHCVDDTHPVYGGMREGLADFGAAFAQWELGQVAGGRAAIGLAQRAFLQDYLQRDLEYWRIPNYGPSAGLLLHFVVTYGKNGEGYRWELYRKFFRDYRACKVKDTRTPTLARAFAFHLSEAFGPQAFADLRRFRWPLAEGDLETVKREVLAAAAGDRDVDLSDQPGSPVPRDQTARQLAADEKDVEDFAAGLGVVRDWWVIGPFKKEGVDPDAYRFPPELEIDLKGRYESINNTPTWRHPGQKPVTVERSGWVQFDWQYMDNSAIYALTHVTVDAEVEAWFHLRADDDLTLFVDDELIGKHDFHRGSGGPFRPRNDVLLPDAVRFPVKLTKGRHKVLLKIRNGGGGAGCSLAIAQGNGRPLPGWRTDLEPPQKRLAAIEMPEGKRLAQRFRADFTQSSTGPKKLEATVGEWRVRNGALEALSTDRGVEWRKYTVRPGFPKDSPSNLAWLPEKATEPVESYSLAIDLAPGSRAPKLCVILQGDGQRDALCGWTLILEPHGDKVRGWLERYDLRVYESPMVPFVVDDKKPTPLVLDFHGKRLSVKLGGQVLFDQAPLQGIPGKHRIGIATWGEEPRIQEIELRGQTRTR
ncbi:MAG: hypothetical protein U1F60_13720 [Planctomycetota bacterium]